MGKYIDQDQIGMVFLHGKKYKDLKINFKFLK